eukprot:TRINITY_DN7680_c0_g3_i1.p1 TRINITY_DN7680_c0_g3~~TRINITY_DN7680_c0_g3_i1.p1  ORF type:complete len:531 (-),score=94.94 TRINITY_DN7680_c0_g3_i1:17-1609(-)
MLEEEPPADVGEITLNLPITKPKWYSRERFSSIITKREAIDEGKEVARLAWPVFLSYLFGSLLYNTNLYFVGHLGSVEYVAAAALSNMYANVTGNSWIIGILSAMETLASQANGAGNYRRVGIVLQRALVVMGVCCIPVVVIWVFAEQVLVLLRQSPEIAKLSGYYIRFLLIGLFPNLVTEALKRYVQTQGMTMPPIFAAGAAAAINPLIQYLFVYKLKLGFMGPPLATSIAQILYCLFLFLYIYFRKLHAKTWFGWSREAFKEWKEFLKLGFPGALMLSLEWGSFEIAALAVGLLRKDVLLAAHLILANTVGLCFMVPLGVSVAASTRVGNLLGAGKYINAKKSAVMSVFFGLTLLLFTSSLLFAVRNVWGKLFTDDADTIKAVSHMLPFIAFGFIMFDGMQGTCGGILRGCGKQKWGAVINLVSFYAVGIPFVFAATVWWKWELMGTWIGLALAEACIAVGYLLVIFKTKWKELSIEAKERAKGEFVHLSEESGTSLDEELQDTKLPILGEENDAVVNGSFQIEDDES